jgi:hypothetical protein
MMLRSFSIAFALVVLGACGDTPQPQAPSTPTGASVPSAGPTADLKPGSPGCTHVVAGKCFSDGAAACKAAGCEGDKCLQAESFPVQVSCKK